MDGNIQIGETRAKSVLRKYRKRNAAKGGDQMKKKEIRESTVKDKKRKHECTKRLQKLDVVGGQEEVEKEMLEMKYIEEKERRMP